MSTAKFGLLAFIGIIIILFILMCLAVDNKADKKETNLDSLSGYTVEEYPTTGRSYSVAYKEVTINGFNYVFAMTKNSIAICPSLNQKK